MNILEALVKMRDDIKLWVTNNLNALNAKIEERTIPIDSELSSTSVNPVQNKVIHEEIASLNDLVGDVPVATQISNAIEQTPHFSGDYHDLANVPSIVDDNSDTMVIIDDLDNIIFKVDDSGVHTTGLSLNGEPAATESYVNEAVAGVVIPEVNLSGYATTKYVDNAIANIDIPEVDLTEYATEDFVLNSIEDTKTELGHSIVSENEEFKVVDAEGHIIFSVDENGARTTEMLLHDKPVATQDYVDEAVANADYMTETLVSHMIANSGHATKKYVDDAINAIDVPKVDLTDYATKQYVDDAIDAIDDIELPEVDLKDYYKKSEVDEAIETAKDDLGQSIESEDEELTVADGKGNIIFKVNWKGVQTTALTIDDENITDIVDNKVAQLVNNAPETLDTLNELSTALGNDPNFATTIATKIGSKVDKETGKGLSSNDFTDNYKDILDNLGSMAFEETDPTVPEWAKAESKPTYSAEEVGLGNVDNTADIDKPVSTATQEALTNLKTELNEAIATEGSKYVKKESGKTLSTNDFTNEYKTAVDNLNNLKPEDIGALPNTTALRDLIDDENHRTVTDIEKSVWNAKSDFSGSYTDLENAPNINDDESECLVITDH